MEFPGSFSFSDYARADEDLMTDEPLTDAAIVQAVRDTQVTPDEDDTEDDDTEPPPPIPSTAQALDHCDALTRYLEGLTDCDPETLRLVDQIEDRINRHSLTLKRQTTIMNFFS